MRQELVAAWPRPHGALTERFRLWLGAGGRASLADGPVQALADALEAERARWFVWLPVFLGLGIALYFACPREPDVETAVLALAAVGAIKAVFRHGLAATVLTGALLAIAIGFTLAKFRSDWVASVPLDHRLRSVEIMGVAELVEPRLPRGQRITLRVSSISGLAPDRLPKRVRIRAMVALQDLKPGEAIRIKATISPPSPPALPGDYDFARGAWFAGIGGIGYALKAPERIAAHGPQPAALRFGTGIEALRQAIGRRITAVLPGETGAIANALITGERGQISDATTDAFRDSGLLHILSISGLHMVVMAGAVFLVVRSLLAIFPAIALRWPIKKWAAASAAAAAFGYLMISGSSVATVRAFLMIAIMLLAVMLERPALAMRNVALAALLILTAAPESLLDVGFQMSFAAVVSLVAVYETAGRESGEAVTFGALHRLARFFGGIALTTMVAGLAVAPFAAYHFHKSQQFAVLANLIAIPICNVIVMPAGLVTLLLMPLGLEAPALAVMGWGIDAMLWAAVAVAHLPGAVGHIPAVPESAFALTVAGGLWLTLWKRPWRRLGIAGIAAGLALAPGLARPDIVISRDGALVAVRGADGRLVARALRPSGFDLTRWLEHDGDARTSADVEKADGMTCDGVGCTAQVKGLTVAVAAHPAAFADDCARADILILDSRRPRTCDKPRLIIDRDALARSGAHAIYFNDAGGMRIETVADRRGVRPWSRPPESHGVETGSVAASQSRPRREWPAEPRRRTARGNSSDRRAPLPSAPASPIHE